MAPTLPGGPGIRYPYAYSEGAGRTGRARTLPERLREARRQRASARRVVSGRGSAG